MTKLNLVFNLVTFIAVGLLCAIPVDLQAQVQVPFRIRGEGVAPEGLPLPGQGDRPHWIVGRATHLGMHTGAGTVQVDSAMGPKNGMITGEFGSGEPFVFEAANGDLLTCYYGRTDFGASQPGNFVLTIVDVLPGDLLVVEALFIAEFVVQPKESTGRFEGATGSWIMFAFSEPFVLGSSDPLPYNWEGNGFITLIPGNGNGN